MSNREGDSWYYHEDPFRLDAESPLAISRSLWDGLSQSEADSRSLFSSTPATETKDSDGTISPLLDSEMVEQECQFLNLDEENTRLKRRRMLLFSGERGNSHDPQLKAFKNPLIEEDEQFMVPDSPTSMWCTRDGESLSSMDDAAEQPTESWMARCFNDSEAQSLEMTAITIESDKSGKDADHEQVCKVVNKKNQVAEFSERSLLSGLRKDSSGSRSKSVIPVAYPFALLKPCGATGDVTLDDINERIQMLPSKSGARLKCEETRSAAGLSGKSVVALTKIHTEGNGTITIMRTKVPVASHHTYRQDFSELEENSFYITQMLLLAVLLLRSTWVKQPTS